MYFPTLWVHGLSAIEATRFRITWTRPEESPSLSFRVAEAIFWVLWTALRFSSSSPFFSSSSYWLSLAWFTSTALGGFLFFPSWFDEFCQWWTWTWCSGRGLKPVHDFCVCFNVFFVYRYGLYGTTILSPSRNHIEITERVKIK